jgi:cell division protein FtsA
MLWDEIRNAGCEKSLNSGLVLTGGGAMLEGMAEIAEQIFDLPVRRGYPGGAGGLIDHVNSPEFATAVGLVMYAHRNHAQQPRTAGGGPFARAAVRIKGLFHGFLGQ